MSHAVQMTNAWKQHVLAGESSEEASRRAFRNLAIPGTVALVTVGAMFATVTEVVLVVVPPSLSVTVTLTA
mgnify:CR=1 FL=1